MRGSKPGERRGGRTKGTPNKATAEIKDIARQYVPEAMRELARLALHAESETARVSAIAHLFDRAYGKPPQSITGPNDGPIQYEDVSARDILTSRIAGLAARVGASATSGKPH